MGFRWCPLQWISIINRSHSNPHTITITQSQQSQYVLPMHLHDVYERHWMECVLTAEHLQSPAERTIECLAHSIPESARWCSAPAKCGGNAVGSAPTKCREDAVGVLHSESAASVPRSEYREIGGASGGGSLRCLMWIGNGWPCSVIRFCVQGCRIDV